MMCVYMYVKVWPLKSNINRTPKYEWHPTAKLTLHVRSRQKATFSFCPFTKS